jgi:cardiolipin synthase
MPRWINVPNGFTLLRVLLVPFVVAEILRGRPVLALALFAAASATDVLDGAAARRLAQVTRAGAYLDPIADKCLLSGVFLALAFARAVPWWLLAVIFGRDLFILLGAAVLWLLSERSFPPSVWGKISTFVQVSTALAWMARAAFPASPIVHFSSAMLWPCAASTIWSGMHYAWRAVQAPRRSGAKPSGLPPGFGPAS